MRRLSILALGLLAGLASCQFSLFGPLNNPLDPAGTEHYEYTSKLLAGFSLATALPDEGANATSFGACVGNVVQMAVGPDGAVYLADTSTARILKIKNNLVTTVAGTGVPGYSGDDGPATKAQIGSLRGLAVANDGTLYFTDQYTANGSYYAPRFRRVSPEGIMSTLAQVVTVGTFKDRAPDYHQVRISPVNQHAFVSCTWDGILEWTGSEFVQAAGAFTPEGSWSSSDANTLAAGRGKNDVLYFTDFAMLSDGSLIVGAATGGFLKVGATTIEKVGSLTSDPLAFAASPDGTVLYYVDNSSARNLVSVPAALNTTGTVATGATFSSTDAPQVLTGFSNTEALYWLPSTSQLIKHNGTATTTVAKQWMPGVSELPGTLVLPNSAAVAANGDVYFAEPAFHVIRKFDGTTLTRVAGTGVPATTTPVGGTALATDLSSPSQLLMSADGVLYFYDGAWSRWYSLQGSTLTDKGSDSSGAGWNKIAHDPVSGKIYSANGYSVQAGQPGSSGFTVAGNTQTSSGLGSNDGTDTGDGGKATLATLANINGLGVLTEAFGGLPSGTLLIHTQVYTPNWANRIRAVSPDGEISTIAGGGTGSFYQVPAKATDLKQLPSQPEFLFSDRHGGILGLATLSYSGASAMSINAEGLTNRVYADKNGTNFDLVGRPSLDAKGNIFAPTTLGLMEYEYAQ